MDNHKEDKMKGEIVYRIEEPVLYNNVLFEEGEIVSHETMMGIMTEYCEVNVTIVTVQ